MSDPQSEAVAPSEGEDDPDAWGPHTLDEAIEHPQPRSTRATRVRGGQRYAWEGGHKDHHEGQEFKRIVKRETARRRRRQAKQDPEEAPTKGYQGWTH